MPKPNLTRSISSQIPTNDVSRQLSPKLNLKAQAKWSETKTVGLAAVLRRIPSPSRTSVGALRSIRNDAVIIPAPSQDLLSLYDVYIHLLRYSNCDVLDRTNDCSAAGSLSHRNMQQMNDCFPLMHDITKLMLLPSAEKFSADAPPLVQAQFGLVAPAGLHLSQARRSRRPWIKSFWPQFLPSFSQWRLQNLKKS